MYTFLQSRPRARIQLCEGGRVPVIPQHGTIPPEVRGNSARSSHRLRNVGLVCNTLRDAISSARAVTLLVQHVQ